MNGRALLFARTPWRLPLLGDARLPGLVLALLVTLAAYACEKVEIRWFGRPWFEALVLAIVIGMAVRSAVPLGARFQAGIDFSAKTLLEVAVMLLGLSVGAQTLLSEGVALLGAIVAVVCAAIGAGYTIGRALGLPQRLAMLVACGNAICGNSAIAAAAPIIDADAKEIAASIAFTAVLGVAVVLVLPGIAAMTGLSDHQFGIFAGMTVYAVPQVIAATVPVSAVSAQIGTLVKLVRVLMLGPVLFVLSALWAPRLTPRRSLSAADAVTPAAMRAHRRPSLGHLLPWFIVGFLALMVLRTLDVVPSFVIEPARTVSNGLTVLAMAGLGLGVDVRTVARSGPRVIAAAVLSLLLLGAMSFAALHVLPLS